MVIQIDTIIKRKGKNGKLVPVAIDEGGKAVITTFPIEVPDLLDLKDGEITTADLVAEFGDKVCTSRLRNSLRVAYRDPASKRCWMMRS